MASNSNHQDSESSDKGPSEQKAESSTKSWVTISEAGASSRRSSRHSKALSSVSSTLALKRAQAEAAKASMEYARKEAELDAQLKILKHEKKVAIAEAEVRALETAEMDIQSRSGRSVIDVPAEDPILRTESFVELHTPSTTEPKKVASVTTDSKLPTEINPKPSNVHSTVATIHAEHVIRSPPTPHQDVSRAKNLPDDSMFSITNTEKSDHPMDCTPKATHSSLNPKANPYRPSQCVDYGLRTHPAAPESSSDFTRFLLKKDLLMSRLTSFDDRPESFNAWKASFCTMVEDLQVTAPEGIDLLIKWLGPESSRFALNIRAANVNNPRKGLQRIWERLSDRYGSPEMVESALKAKLAQFPKLSNKDTKKLYELSDILSEIESIKENSTYAPLFAYFDSSSGIIPIVNKLPYGLQERWTSEAIRYKRLHNVIFPPFSLFVEFIQEVSRSKNDPSFCYDNNSNNPPPQRSKPTSRNVTTRKTTVDSNKTEVKPGNIDMNCPLHNVKHSLNQCRGFRMKTITDRKKLLKDKGICFRCCTTSSHLARDCQETIKCSECDSSRHPTALHVNHSESSSQGPASGNVGGEQGQQAKVDLASTVTSRCTQICGKGFQGKSCGKTILVRVYPSGKPESAILTYAILDDQSNSTLARSDFFDHFNVDSCSIPYSLTSCSGRVNTSGRRGQGFIVESLDRRTQLQLPSIIECNQIPCVREEIPTPEVAIHFAHLHDLATLIPPVDESAEILLLIGRDTVDAHHVLDQRIGPLGSPYAQRLRLGWVIIGETCLGKVHPPETVNVNKTYLHKNDRQSIFRPCPHDFVVKEQLDLNRGPVETPCLGSAVFQTTKDDDKPGLSVDDREFINLMDREFSRKLGDNWTAPLPFRTPRPRLPNNKSQAVKRAQILHNSLLRNPVKKDHFVTFMKGILDNGHAEVAPPVGDEEECWYLPIFGVYHPKKPHQIRGVFDSSAEHQGVSLNSVLLTGPNLTNSLVGVLMRFRTGTIGFTADIEQMFYCFKVNEDHRNFLRFLWYKDNDPSQPIIEYRMRVHVFGNSPSPAVATYGLRKAAEQAQTTYGNDVKEFIENDFYVDDALNSLPTPTEAIDLLKRTQQALKANGNIRLHKVASNSAEVMRAFPSSDHAKEFKDLDLSVEEMPLQRSLGLTWDLKSDSFTFQVPTEEKPYTRRGVLSTVNSLYDPLGFVAPVVIQGKLLLRQLLQESSRGWDEPLPVEYRDQWVSWTDSLGRLEALRIQRPYNGTSVANVVKQELQVFSDASQDAIAAVAYLKTTDEENDINVGFVLGKAKVAPSHSHTIPRLELCAAVLAVEISETVCDHLDIPTNSVQYYTDSKVVLGYIHNRSRRLYVYVSNRVDRIRKSSSPDQWNYVPTQSNPADQGTRSVPANCMGQSMWLLGPSFLSKKEHVPDDTHQAYPLEDPENDSELRPDVTTCATNTTTSTSLGSHRFERFSSWNSLVCACLHLRHIAQSFHTTSTQCKGWHVCSKYKDASCYAETEKFIIREVQRDVYSAELASLQNHQPLPRKTTLASLSPALDTDGLLRVGGRLSRSDISLGEKNPIIIPGRHHVATLIVRHYHQSIQHQGRHFTEGAIRAAGFWIVGGKRLISSVLHACVTCRKQRGKFEHQKMSDLPTDRVNPAPPFAFVGVDMFGPWNVLSRRTRGGQANSKRWAALFTCLVTRTIHIEVVEEMTTSSFINALRRFVAIRGKVQEFRSDRGTNFVGSTDHLGIEAINVDDGPVAKHLFDSGSRWIFNSPHSSHMGGVWERMIGITRRILDTMIAKAPSKHLTHEVLVTFLSEVCAIVNSRPIVPVSSDSEFPTVLTPSTLLTQKTDHTVKFPGTFDVKDMYRSQWKRVQCLADTFWSRWRREYLQTLQPRRKWQEDRPYVKPGDVVLLKEQSLHRNNWPMGIIQQVIPSEDRRIRKAQIKVIRDGKPTTYLRPITEMVVLLSE